QELTDAQKTEIIEEIEKGTLNPDKLNSIIEPEKEKIENVLENLKNKEGVEITKDDAGNMITEIKIGEEGTFKYLDQALRRVAGGAIPKEYIIEGKISAEHLGKIENALANLRNLLTGKVNEIGGVKAEDLNGIIKFEHNNLSIENPEELNKIIGELYKHSEIATEKPGSLASAFVGKTDEDIWTKEILPKNTDGTDIKITGYDELPKIKPDHVHHGTIGDEVHHEAIPEKIPGERIPTAEEQASLDALVNQLGKKLTPEELQKLYNEGKIHPLGYAESDRTDFDHHHDVKVEKEAATIIEVNPPKVEEKIIPITEVYPPEGKIPSEASMLASARGEIIKYLNLSKEQIDRMDKIINIKDEMSLKEETISRFLIDNKGSVDVAMNAIEMVEKNHCNILYEDALKYFSQLENVQGNAFRMEGVVDFLNGGEGIKKGLGKIFGVEVNENNYVFKKGMHKIDLKNGFYCVIEILKDNKIKIGGDGPSGFDIGMKGSLFQAPHPILDLNNENIETIAKKIKENATYLNEEWGKFKIK
ncbi:MAG: hypothetical protein ABH808_01230, partial [Candidatus Kuenenbacteria bacterium]